MFEWLVEFFSFLFRVRRFFIKCVCIYEYIVKRLFKKVKYILINK